jgi:hypothetical protein
VPVDEELKTYKLILLNGPGGILLYPFNPMQTLRTVNVTRYITPLREGGSLPAITEADDGFKYVLKFRGAGQGKKALIAELIGGELARTLGLRVPEIVLAKVDEAFGRTEPDEEIQDLLKASTGLNLALHYLSGSITFDPVVTKVDPLLASRIVWLDSLIGNVDRTVRNTNMLWWNKELWLIDHGASLYFHHSDAAWEEMPLRPFELIGRHVLLEFATRMAEADVMSKKVLTADVISSIVALIPDDWLGEDTRFASADRQRNAYATYLQQRIAGSQTFVHEIEHARKALV